MKAMAIALFRLFWKLRAVYFAGVLAKLFFIHHRLTQVILVRSKACKKYGHDQIFELVLLKLGSKVEKVLFTEAATVLMSIYTYSGSRCQILDDILFSVVINSQPSS